MLTAIARTGRFSEHHTRTCIKWDDYHMWYTIFYETRTYILWAGRAQWTTFVFRDSKLRRRQADWRFFYGCMLTAIARMGRSSGHLTYIK